MGAEAWKTSQKRPVSTQRDIKEISKRFVSALYHTCRLILEWSLQHTATHCNTLQHTPQHTLQHTATHTATRTATHSSTVQHTCRHILEALRYFVGECSTLRNTHPNTHCNTHCYTHSRSYLPPYPWDAASSCRFRFCRLSKSRRGPVRRWHCWFSWRCLR